LTKRERYDRVDKKEGRMPYKSEEARREASRRSMVKKRRGLTLGINNQGIAREGLTDPKVRHLAESLIDPIRRSKLILLSNALDKTMTGLDGKRVSIDSMVRYGIWGFRFDEIKELL